MKINWKLRLQNKTTLLALMTLTVGFVYQILSLFEIVPSVTQDSIMNVVLLAVNLLAALGVITDPTTKGLSDSAQAMRYIEPKDGEK